MARSWRSELAALSGAALLGLAAWPVAAAEPPAALVVFWTADDCPWCNTWKNGDRRPEFELEAARLGVAIGVQRKPSLRSPDSQFAWQEAAFPAPAGLVPPRVVPSFDFTCRGQALKRLTSMADWDSFWRAELRRLARQCKPGS